MPIKTTLEQIEEVQTAISDILLTGQFMGKDGKQLNKANLQNLNDRETMLLARHRQEERGGLTIKGVTPC